MNIDNEGVEMALGMALGVSFCDNSKNRPNFVRKIYKVEGCM